MLIGHEEAQKNLRRLAEGGQLSHAYLFFGPAETGKFSAAMELAAFLERRSGEAAGRPLTDAVAVLPDENGVIGIDAIRSVRTFLSERPFSSTRRTVIIDRAETMTDEAQNALLKIAEEPPPAGLLIAITADPESLRATLVSRFQKIYFGAVSAKKITAWLIKEGVAKNKAEAAAGASGGKPGLALRLARDGASATEYAARRFLKTTPAGRKEFIKGLLEDENFNFRAFLDALILVSAEDAGRNGELWHAVIELRALADATGLSPRIQLMNLGAYL